MIYIAKRKCPRCGYKDYTTSCKYCMVDTVPAVSPDAFVAWTVIPMGIAVMVWLS